MRRQWIPGPLFLPARPPAHVKKGTVMVNSITVMAVELSLTDQTLGKGTSRCPREISQLQRVLLIISDHNIQLVQSIIISGNLSLVNRCMHIAHYSPVCM